MYITSFGIAIYNGCRSHVDDEENLQSESPIWIKILSSAPPKVHVHPRSNASPTKQMADSSSVQASSPPSTQSGEDGEMFHQMIQMVHHYFSDPPSYKTAF